MRLSLLSALSVLAAPPPMVVVPGLTNSIIQYQLVNAEPFKNCNTSTQGQWLSLYPPPENMTLAERTCWVEDFAVTFNTSTNLFQNKRRGVLTRVMDFGGIQGLPALSFLIPYWQGMGWTLGQNLFGAPYDWRYGSSGRPDSFHQDLQALVERSYSLNQRPAIIMAPSFGPQLALGFLHRMTQEWKDKYVSWFIAISPVFGGAVMPAQYWMSGVPANPELISKLVRQEVQAIATPVWMFPRAGANSTTSWTKDEPILSTPAKNYSAFDMLQAFTDLGFTDAIPQLKFLANESDLGAFAPPGVNTYVTYGYNVPTPGPVVYPHNFVPNMFPANPTNQTISGDSVVPVRSSVRGLVWAADMEKAGKKLWHRGFQDEPHAGCLVPPGLSPEFPDDGCYREMYAFIVNGTVPPALLHTSHALD